MRRIVRRLINENEGGEIIWVYGGRIAHDFRITPYTKNILHQRGNRES